MCVLVYILKICLKEIFTFDAHDSLYSLRQWILDSRQTTLKLLIRNCVKIRSQAGLIVQDSKSLKASVSAN